MENIIYIVTTSYSPCIDRTYASYSPCIDRAYASYSPFIYSA